VVAHVGQGQDISLIILFLDHVAGLGTKKKMIKVHGVLHIANTVMRAVQDQDEELVIRFKDFYDHNKVKAW
jgi:hypothetical protein